MQLLFSKQLGPYKKFGKISGDRISNKNLRRMFYGGGFQRNSQIKSKLRDYTQLLTNLLQSQQWLL